MKGVSINYINYILKMLCYQSNENGSYKTGTLKVLMICCLSTCTIETLPEVVSGRVCQQQSVNRSLSTAVCQPQSVNRSLSTAVCQPQSVNRSLSPVQLQTVNCKVCQPQSVNRSLSTAVCHRYNCKLSTAASVNRSLSTGTTADCQLLLICKIAYCNKVLSTYSNYLRYCSICSEH